MKKLMLGLLVFGLTTQFMNSQEIELSEVRIDVNYKYLDAIDSKEVALSVRKLEEEVAFYNLKESDLYNDEYETYKVSFYIPKGMIIAAYDKNGKITRTIERFKNVKLPKSISETIMSQYPNWSFVEDTYKVDYYGKSGRAIKQYRVKLKNEKKRKTVKFDGNGEYL